MAVKQLDLRRFQDVVILVVASMGLLTGMLIGFPSDAVSDAADRDKDWAGILATKKHAKRGKATPAHVASSKRGNLSRTAAERAKATSKNQDSPRKNGAATASPLPVGGSSETDLEGQGDSDPGATNAGEKAGSLAGFGETSPAVSASGLNIYGIWAIWALFLVAAIWESTKSIAAATSKKLAPLTIGHAATSAVLVVVALLISRHLFNISVESPPIDAVSDSGGLLHGIELGSVILILLNIVQILLYKHSISDLSAEGEHSKPTSAWSMLPTMAKVSGAVGATLFAAGTVGQVRSATSPAPVAAKAPPPQIIQNPVDPRVLAMILDAERSVQLTQQRLDQDLAAQAASFNTYGQQLQIENGHLERVASNTTLQGAILKVASGDQQTAKKSAQETLVAQHTKVNESLQAEIGNESQWQSSQKGKITLEGQVLDEYDKSIKSLTARAEVARKAWTDNELPFAYYQSSEEDLERMKARRDQERLRLVDLVTDAKGHLEIFTQQLKANKNVEEARTATAWSLTYAHNLELGKINNPPSGLNLDTQNLATPGKFISDLNDKLAQLNKQDGQSKEQIWDEVVALAKSSATTVNAQAGEPSRR